MSFLDFLLHDTCWCIKSGRWRVDEYKQPVIKRQSLLCTEAGTVLASYSKTNPPPKSTLKCQT